MNIIPTGYSSRTYVLNRWLSRISMLTGGFVWQAVHADEKENLVFNEEVTLSPKMLRSADELKF